MGGDQCYPQATREEYKLRLQTPYDWAYHVPVAERKLFAIPGNHDWYDGLSAFDSLFCSARDRMSQQNGNKIGGWQCKQHRSYWAIELPYRWWIWGCDIQFSQYLDISQVNYFEAIAGLMGPGDNLIICIAQPTWMIAQDQGFDEDSNFFKITSIARRRGIKICAVIAGDWHHYNRYYAPGLDVQVVGALRDRPDRKAALVVGPVVRLDRREAHERACDRRAPLVEHAALEHGGRRFRVGGHGIESRPDRPQ